MVMRILDNALCWIRRKACVQLHIPHCEVWLTLEFFDEHGNLTKKRRQRSKSWVQNAYNQACVCMMQTGMSGSCGVGVLGIRDINNICRSNTGTTFQMLPSGDQRLTTGLGTWSHNTLRGAVTLIHGLVIGRGTTAESFTGYALATPIANGYDTNQVSYQQQDVYAVSYNAGTKTLKATHSRVINNNSDADISLTETACYGQGFHSTSSGRATYMTCRDLLDPAETFNDKAQLRVTYEISLTYTA